MTSHRLCESMLASDRMAPPGRALTLLASAYADRPIPETPQAPLPGRVLVLIFTLPAACREITAASLVSGEAVLNVEVLDGLVAGITP